MGVRFERMVIEAGSNTFSLIAHPRLTVIAGVGHVERDALVAELLGALGSSRSGVHTELVDDNGRRLAVFRPRSGRHVVVDIDQAVDVSDEYRTAEGRLDLLAHEDIDTRTSRRFLRLTRTDLASSAQSDEMIRTLASQNQTELWSAAARVRVTDDALTKEADKTGSAPEDAEMIETIEARHRAFESAAHLNQRLRKYAAILASVSLVGGLATAVFLSFSQGLALLALTAVLVGFAFWYQQRVNRAEADEQAALQSAGAASYLGFHLQRVNGMLSDENSRKRLMACAEDHRQAAARWATLAGDVSVDWALEHHEEIVAAARLRRDIQSVGSRDDEFESTRSQTADLAHAVVGRLARARGIGRTGESFPLIFDDPFVGLEGEVKFALLELLCRSAGSPQVILLTDDEEVATWARDESSTGSLSVLEPMPEGEAATDHLAV
jgi:hypothetical protein